MFKILSIYGIKTDTYTMWYRYKKSNLMKIFIVGDTIVSPNAKIQYICDYCHCIHKTILRTFNDRFCKKYNSFKYLCKPCVDSRVYLSADEQKLRKMKFKEDQEKTKEKNGTRPKDLIKKHKKFGFVGRDQSKGSEIRNKMNNTKLKNDSNTNVGTEAYFKRLKTYLTFDDNKKLEISLKQNETKFMNGTHPKQKFLRGDSFGFCNMTESNRKKLSTKIDLILKTKDYMGITKYQHANRTRISRMKEQGKLINDLDLSDFKLYSKRVWQITNLQNLQSLDNYHLRGRSDINPNSHHLDHRYSIKAGFLNSIPVHIIGNIANLSMIPYKENAKKQDKCSIDIDSLVACIYNMSKH